MNTNKLLSVRSLLIHMLLVATAAASTNAARAHVWVTIDVEPGEDWCDIVQYAAANGDVVRLAPGDYEGDCLVLKSGIPAEGEPMAIVGRGDGPVRILGKPGAPVVTIFGNYVRLGLLTLVPAPGEAAVVVRGRSALIDGCIFEGGSVGLNLDGATGGFSVIGNTFEEVAVPITSRCADAACDKSRAVLRDNVFRSAMPDRAGAAVTIETRAEIDATDNVIEGAWYTGFDLTCLDGPVKLQHNVILGGEIGVRVTAGAGAVDIVNNAVVATRRAAVHVAAGGVGSVRIGANTLVPAAGAVVEGLGAYTRLANAVLSPDEATEGSDVVCADAAACWEAPADGDFRPRPDGPLVGAELGAPRSLVNRDLCGDPRGAANAVGAFSAGRAVPMYLQPVRKSLSDCFDSDHIDERLRDRAPWIPPVMAPPLGDGCQGGGEQPVTWLGVVLFLVFTVRSRVRSGV